MKTRIGIVDDHQLFLKSLGLMLESFNNYDVVLEALNGKDMQEKMKGKKLLPEIMLIDVNMPVMDGIATARWLKENHPSIKLVALSMNNNDNTIINMLKAGCCAYLLKDTHPDELEKALHEIILKGRYNADAANINYHRLIVSESNNEDLHLTDKEKLFLQFACTDITYKQIAEKMHLGESTIDSYRAMLFKKLNVQSRVGLVLEAMKRNLITPV